jgi:hypothetical protein
MIAATRPTCTHTRLDGTPCRAAALPGKDCCTFHDPELSGRRAAGRRQGGETRSRRAAVLAGAADVTFTAVGDVTALLAATASQVRRGELDCKVGNCLAYIAATALRALMPDEIARQVEELRQQVDELRGRRDGGDGDAPGTDSPPPGGGSPNGEGDGQPDLAGDPLGPGRGDDIGGDDSRPVAEATVGVEGIADAAPLFPAER